MGEGPDPPRPLFLVFPRFSHVNLSFCHVPIGNFAGILRNAKCDDYQLAKYPRNKNANEADENEKEPVIHHATAKRKIRQKNPKITCPFMCADHCRTDRNSVKEFYDLYGYELGESKVANATYEIFWLTHT
tara:strand:+ start:799 stop:1191 length:393 start_codon:yes stop_codon:yes gene_type:complete